MQRLTAVAPYGRAGASARVRLFDWLDHLGMAADSYDYLGLATSQPGALLRDPIALATAELRVRRLATKSLDRLFLHREASPLSRGELERRLLGAARLSIYDFDDALQWDHGRGGVARRWAPKSDKCLYAVRTADRVIAGNPLLADWASEWARDVVVIPSCVDPTRYPAKVDYRLHDPPRLGWVGTPSTEANVVAIAPALREVHRRTGARLTVVSSGHAALAELDGMVDRTKWNPESLGEVLQSFDLAIAPLRGHLLARGKCAYKLLQYSAGALPFVASPVGANEQVLALAGAAGATTIDDWVDQLEVLLGYSSDKRAGAGQQARRCVTQRYSFAAWADAWLAAVSAEVRSATTRGIGPQPGLAGEATNRPNWRDGGTDTNQPA